MTDIITQKGRKNEFKKIEFSQSFFIVDLQIDHLVIPAVNMKFPNKLFLSELFLILRCFLQI